MENNVKSLTNEFKMLPLDKQIKVLIEDAKNASISDEYQDKFIDSGKGDEYCDITFKINKSKTIEDKIKYTKELVMFYRRLEIPDYYTLYLMIRNNRDRIYNKLEDLVYNVFVTTAPNVYNTDINKVDEPKNQPVHELKEVSVNKGITPSSIASVFTNNPQPIEQYKCSCGGHHENKNHTCTCGCNNNHQQIVNAKIHPELNLSQKVDLLKKRITFIPAEVDVKEIDALLWMLEGKMLNSKLMEYQATTGNLVQKANIDFDKSQYNFAFEAESNIPGKRIIVLFNTNATIIPEINQYGYALNIYLDNK